jgi:hypothetical protein
MVATYWRRRCINPWPARHRQNHHAAQAIETIRRERRVLVCAPSNTAVDLLTEKLAERGVNVIQWQPRGCRTCCCSTRLDAQIMNHKSYAELRPCAKRIE